MSAVRPNLRGLQKPEALTILPPQREGIRGKKPNKPHLFHTKVSINCLVTTSGFCKHYSRKACTEGSEGGQ